MPDSELLKDLKRKCCSICEKTLPAFGVDRKNGVETYGDWKGRTTHKKCQEQYYLIERLSKMSQKYINDPNLK